MEVLVKMISKLIEELKKLEWVDLTHSFDENSPRWKGFKPLRKEVILDFNEYPVKAHEYTFPGQYGTHIDVPAHADPDGMTLDKIELKRCLNPLCVIDCSKQVRLNNDYALNIKDILDYEEKYGKIPEGAFVAMRSDWYLRWNENEAFLNYDEMGNPRYPGWDIEALKFLIEERKINCIGHETIDTDPPQKEDQKYFKGECYVLKKQLFQIEVMANLDKVPPCGAIIMSFFPKQKGATGFPVRCFAMF